MAVMKDIPIHESVRLQLRGEAYGALNHVYFQTNQNNFTLYTGLNYATNPYPVATANNINTAYGDVGSNIGGNRTIQLAVKLYF
jgi:hypothetical protein